jgi:hypothetical protein
VVSNASAHRIVRDISVPFLDGFQPSVGVLGMLFKAHLFALASCQRTLVALQRDDVLKQMGRVA